MNILLVGNYPHPWQESICVFRSSPKDFRGKTVSLSLATASQPSQHCHHIVAVLIPSA